MVLNVYVDDFKLVGRGDLGRVWTALKAAGLDIDEPVKYQTYLGCAQRPIDINPVIFRQQIEVYRQRLIASVQLVPKPQEVRSPTEPLLQRLW